MGHQRELDRYVLTSTVGAFGYGDCIAESISPGVGELDGHHQEIGPLLSLTNDPELLTMN